MKIIYEIITTSSGIETIKADLGNGHLLFIPCDPANSDYQTYLKSLEAEQSTPEVPLA
jgi:hypothetical protein